MGPDLPLDIGGVGSVAEVASIAALYPAKSTAEREEMIRRHLRPEFAAMTEGRRVILLARHAGEVVGTVQVVWDGPDDRAGLLVPGAAMIHHLRTHPAWQGRGIGTRLLGAGERVALQRGLTHLTLGVEPDNARALRLYRAVGYEEFHRYRGEQGEEIIGMRKALAG